MKTKSIILSGILLFFCSSSVIFGNEINAVLGLYKSTDLYSSQKFFAIALGLFIALGLMVNAVVWFINTSKAPVNESIVPAPAYIGEDNIKVLKGIYFDKSHTWAFMDANGGVKIGIDDFLLRVTGPITRIKLVEEGQTVKKGDNVITLIQDGKHLNIKSPISGVIKEQNPILPIDSSILNSSPFSDGWVYMIEPTNWLREVKYLIMADKYKEWIKNEFTKLKDFIALFVQANSEGEPQLVLQDGGEIKDNVLADFGPEIWEEFQMKFIDS